MSTDHIPYAAPGQPAAPGVLGFGASAPAAAVAVPIPGTHTSGGPSISAPSVIPIATPAPPAAASPIPISTPEQPALPGVAPVSLPNGSGLPSPVTQEQLAQALAHGARPIITKPNGDEVTLTVDNDNNLGEEPVE